MARRFTIEILMNCEFPVSDFEIVITGLIISGAYGGSSEDSNFTINYRKNTIGLKHTRIMSKNAQKYGSVISLLNEAEKITQKKLQPGQGLFTQTLFPTLIHRGSLPIAVKMNPPLIEHCYKLKKEWEEIKQNIFG